MTAAGARGSFLIDSGVSLPGEASPLRIAIDVQMPDASLLAQQPVAFVCLPGGAMNRHYYDLQAEGDDSYSFAAQMAKRGFITVMVDHPGIGDSDRPADGYALTPDVVAQANSNAIAKVLADLKSGNLIAGCAALPNLVSILVGHSMGAMFTVLQQAQFKQHAAIALLGFSTRGLPEYTSPEVRELAKDTTALRSQLAPLARKMFVESYPVIKPSPQAKSVYSGANAEAKGVAALKRAMDKLLPVPAFMSMVPGNVLPEARSIDVPVFLGIGELDMVGPTHEIPASFTGSHDVTLYILPQTGHSHFLFPARSGLFSRLAAWARIAASGS
jgi:pimeloyl-ACP methyl ester carboxylesterase